MTLGLNQLNMAAMEAETHRQHCYICNKPKVVCICNQVVPIENQTKIVILQHKCERNHAIGTARIAKLGLCNVETVVVWPDEKNRLVCNHRLRGHAGLLLPGPGAVDLASLPDGQKPDELIVLDGTWSKAGKLLKHNPWLEEIPRYCLSPESPSRYRIRREPNREAISTVEAIYQSLEILEPDTPRLDSLMEVFDAMIDTQVEYARKFRNPRSKSRFKRQRNKEQRAISRDLIACFENVVVAHGETVPHPTHKRTLVRWAAVRLFDGEVFDALVIPESGAEITDSQLAPMEIPKGDLHRAIEPGSLSERWSQFLKNEDFLVTWNKPTMDVFNRIIGGERKGVWLKESLCNYTGNKSGHLKDVVKRLSLPTDPLPLQGRIARYLQDAVAVARYLRGLSSSEDR